MSLELRESLIIGAEVLVLSILLIIVSLFGSYSKNALVLKQYENDVITDINEYRNIYEFTEGQEVTKEYIEKTYSVTKNTNGSLNNLSVGLVNALGITNVATGDDIIRFMSLYPKAYDVCLKTNNFNIAFTKDSDEKVWEIGYISDLLNEDLNSEFYCFAIYDEYRYVYDSIVFIKKG